MIAQKEFYYLPGKPDSRDISCKNIGVVKEDMRGLLVKNYHKLFNPKRL